LTVGGGGHIEKIKKTLFYFTYMHPKLGHNNLKKNMSITRAFKYAASTLPQLDPN
jgi:hypothetical protein